MLSNSITSYLEIHHKRKSQCTKISSLSYFNKWQQASQPSATIILISQQSSTLTKTLHQKIIVSDDCYQFLATKYFLIKV
jgi:hypothetical protein